MTDDPTDPTDLSDLSDLSDVEGYFDRLGSDVPDRSPSMAQIVALGGAAKRRRTTWSALAAAAAVVLVVAGGAVAVGGSGGHRSAHVAATDMPVAAPGFKLVGRGRVVVSVPQAWRPSTAFSCGGAPGHTYYLDVEVADFCPGLLAPGPTVGLLPASSLRGTDHGPVCRPRRPCQSTSQHLGVAIVLSGTRSQISALRDTIAILPAGWTAVPSIVGETVPIAAAATSAVGLQLDVVSTGGAVTQISSQQPAAGTVVVSGSRVQADRVDEVPVGSVDDLLGRWRPSSVGGATVAVTGADDITFTHSDVEAPDGCNSAEQRFTVGQGGSFSVRGVVLDDRCSSSAVMDSARLLRETAQVFLDPSGDLVLVGADGTELATYMRDGQKPRTTARRYTRVTDIDRLLGTHDASEIGGTEVLTLSFALTFTQQPDGTLRYSQALQCETETGTWALTDGTLHLSRPIITRTGCTSPGTGPLNRVHNLPRATSAWTDGQSLQLRDAAGEVLARYSSPSRG